MVLKSRTENPFGIELHHFGHVAFDDIALQYLNWLNDPEIVSSIGSPILMQPKNLDFIKESYKRFTSPTCMGFFIFDSINSKYLGTAKIDKICSHNKSAEIGIMIGSKSYWGKGVATSVYKILLFYCFNELALNRVWGGTDSNNLAMRRTFLKLGFIEEGVQRQANKINDTFSDTHLFGMLKNEFNEN